jgi:hypothetical protein
MAGDSLRDAFRARLQTHVTTAGLTLPVKDLVNTKARPDASASFIALDFPGGTPERQLTFGAPGANFHDETGQVTILVCGKPGHDRDTCEAAAEALRNLFRMDRFAARSRTVRITATAPMGGGEDDGGFWVESVALFYEVINVG